MHVCSLPDGYQTTDAAIASTADTEGRVVVRKDSDFRHSHLAGGIPAHLLILITLLEARLDAPSAVDRPVPAQARPTDRQPPPYTRLLLDSGTRPEPTPRRLSSLPLTDALAGDSSWNPRRRRHAVPEEHATDTSHMTQQHRDSPAGHGEIRWVMTPKRVIVQHGAPSAVAPPVARSSWPTRATYPHGGPACYPYAPAIGMREQWRILIYSVCAGQPS